MRRIRQAPESFHLPTQSDFQAFEGWLDQICAWEHFGGMNLSQAYDCFCEKPEYYQADFLWMGPKAFHFYFPVIERYLHEFRLSPENDESEAYSLGHAVHSQLQGGKSGDKDKLAEKITALAHFIIQNNRTLAREQEDRTRMVTKWSEVLSLLETH